MAVREGTYELGPDNGRLLVRTGRSGLGRRAGHDLILEATRWSATVQAREPLDTSSVEVVVPPDGLEVRAGTGGVKPLTDQDRAEIEKTLGKVLDTRRHPEITFTSTNVGTDAIEGDLKIMGRVKPVRVTAALEGDVVRGSATVTQSRWGIKPYSAFFGALRLADDVEVEFEVTLPA
ncbi:polyisoprenoid-binding protein YceI [Actinomadura pelletieri DSM 43383]|uniref:Polyisoprenoid-binding protein YceI n=1 Tax=Actinomadura pelletieri DSM 43383 TaxID=1120940 RepID=A0A495QJA8_9ACTN|nr:YceI family protein [Actinomadura pelletieri]RKS72243.1 polyisoprenoid-binding protein YceI [Actinomadura pelletieri DSM 43383]